MVPGADRALTKIGFRRDVWLFFGSLTAFFAVLVLLLLLLLQTFLRHELDATRSDWSNIAQSCVSDLSESNALSQPAQLESHLTMLQSRYSIAGITVSYGGWHVAVGVPATAANVEAVVRQSQGATMVFVFDASSLESSSKTFWATAAISLIATTLVSALLLLYLPRVTTPIEHMLDAASEIETRHPDTDEQQYLIDTFRKSIDTLKAQEAELQRMHDAQKSRADDLERVTSTLTRSLTSGFLAVDPTGCVVEMNAAAREILLPRAAPPATVEEAFGPGPFTEAIRRAAAERIGFTRAEIEITDDDGSHRVVGLSTVPLLGEQQQFLGLLALFTDLTPIRDLESRIRDLQTLADLGEISAGIAHEFRNSLSAILGNLRLATLEPLPDKPLAQIERAQKEAVLLAEAVDGLLAFARPMRLVRTPIDLLDVAHEVAERMTLPPGVAIAVAGQGVTIEGDGPLLSRALENLVRNAIDAVQQKGGGHVAIEVSAAPRPSMKVVDDGIGLNSADVPRLMLPFQSDKPSGYGLGLALARKIALLHGGGLQLTGQPGRGATAIIDFVAPATTRAVQFVTTLES